MNEKLNGLFSASDVLAAWGYSHFGDRAFCTIRGAEATFLRTNWRFLFGEWQRTLGATSVDGKLTGEQVNALYTPVAEAARREAASAAGSQPLPADNANLLGRLFGRTFNARECPKTGLGSIAVITDGCYQRRGPGALDSVQYVESYLLILPGSGTANIIPMNTPFGARRATLLRTIDGRRIDYVVFEVENSEYTSAEYRRKLGMPSMEGNLIRGEGVVEWFASKSQWDAGEGYKFVFEPRRPGAASIVGMSGEWFLGTLNR